MPFGVVSGVGRDEVEIVEGEGAISGMNVEHPAVTNGIFVAYSHSLP